MKAILLVDRLPRIKENEEWKAELDEMTWQLADLNKNFDDGLVTFADFEVARNKLRKRLLHHLRSYEKQDKGNGPSNKLSIVGFGISLIMVLVSTYMLVNSLPPGESASSTRIGPSQILLTNTMRDLPFFFLNDGSSYGTAVNGNFTLYDPSPIETSSLSLSTCEGFSTEDIRRTKTRNSINPDVIYEFSLKSHLEDSCQEKYAVKIRARDKNGKILNQAWLTHEQTFGAYHLFGFSE